MTTEGQNATAEGGLMVSVVGAWGSGDLKVLFLFRSLSYFTYFSDVGCMYTYRPVISGKIETI